MLALEGRCAEARDAFRQALNLPDVPRDIEAILRNNVACASLMLDELEEADAESSLGWWMRSQSQPSAVPGARLLKRLYVLGEEIVRPARFEWATYRFVVT
jgi:Flp pilus assembly protein TadD